MAIATTTTRNREKAFAWSYSKLKNFESCPKRHFHVDLQKDFREEESEQLAYGNALHKALALAVTGEAPLPDHFKTNQKWVDKITSPSNADTVIVTEQQFAITKDFGPTTWFGHDAWYRGIADVIKKTGPVALAVDWKTGKILEDGTQLALMAACIFAHVPDIQAIRTEFVWIKEDATTRADFKRGDMPAVWASVLPRVRHLSNAAESMNYPPKPGSLCRKWCPVSACPHHGM